jgi:hypothetical protein
MDLTPDPTPFFIDFKDVKNFHILFLQRAHRPQAHHLQFKKLNLLLKFCVQILFCRHYFSPLNTFMMRKGNDPDSQL